MYIAETVTCECATYGVLAVFSAIARYHKQFSKLPYSLKFLRTKFRGLPNFPRKSIFS